jgi:hypothetical protein
VREEIDRFVRPSGWESISLVGPVVTRLYSSKSRRVMAL